MNCQALASYVLNALRRSDVPMTASQIARKIPLRGGHETQRRTIRAAIQYLRDWAGLWIIATLQSGYLLTDDPDLWRDYNEGRKIDGKKLIGKAHREQKMISDSQGQGLLFQPQIARMY